MTFHVYPDPAGRPLVVPAGATSPAVRLAEPVPPGGGGVQKIFVRCAVSDAGHALPAGAEPDVLLVADGAETAVTSVNGVNPTPVAGGRAFATVFPSSPASGRVFRVEVFKNDPGPIGWQIRFRNPLPAGQMAMAIMWVVADNAAESRQPWIDVPSVFVPALSGHFLDARPGQTVTTALRIGNHGTGPLTLTDPVGTLLAPGLSVAAVPPPVPPDGHGDLGFSFTGQSEPAFDAIVYLVASNDTTVLSEFPAGEEATHVNLTELFVTTHPPMPALAAGDILVCDPRGLVRVDPSTGRQTAVARDGMFEGVWDVAVEPSGDLLCSITATVIRIDRASGTFRILSDGGALLNASSLALAADGSVLVVNEATGEITRVHPGTGAQSQAFDGTGPGGGPMVIAPDGSVLTCGSAVVEGSAAGALVRIDLAAGTSTVLFQKQGFGFEGVAVAPDGTVFVVANQFNNRQHMLIRFNPATGQQTVVFNRPDILLSRVVLTARGEPLLTGSVWPHTTVPVRGLLLRLDPSGTTSGDWAVHEVSAGDLLILPNGLAIVPPAVG